MLARTVDDNGGAYVVPAFTGLFAPHWRSDARGAIVGLTRFVNRGHLARAALEATAFQSQEVIDAMADDSGVELSELKVDGGMVANELLMQFQADLLGVEVVRPVVAETTALGAAYAAGLAVGFWDSTAELVANWAEDKRWTPQMPDDERQRLLGHGPRRSSGPSTGRRREQPRPARDEPSLAEPSEQLAGGTLPRQRTSRRDGRRRAAAGRRRRRDALGQLTVARELRERADVQDRARGARSAYLVGALGVRRTAGRLLPVAGLELKRELVVGDLSDVQRAILPVVAAACGVVVPALFYVAVVAGVDGAARGWAVPTATDIAFALAALAVLGSHLPSALRSFLLTLAVVDDLIAITIIAVFYTADLKPLLLLGSVVPLLAFGWLVRRRRAPSWLLVPLALATWTMVHASGVHATVAGMALAFTVPVRPHGTTSLTRAPSGWSTGSARCRPGLRAGLRPDGLGGTLVGGGLGDAVSDRVTWAVVVGLVVGKLVGVFGGTFLTARLTRAELDEDLAWGDVLGVSLLGGIGFTVSLLVGELAFEDDPARHAHVKLGVLIASVLAALLAGLVLRRRERVYRAIAERDSRDGDGDGVPDIYQPGHD